MSGAPFTGRCLCGRVAVSVPRERVIAAACHCTHCQRQTASAFSPVLVVPLGSVTVTGELKGYDDVNDHGDRVVRMFCPNCGSPVMTQSVNDAKTGTTIVKAGLLDGGAPAPAVEVFTRSRRDWLPGFPSTQHRFEAGPTP